MINISETPVYEPCKSDHAFQQKDRKNTWKRGTLFSHQMLTLLVFLSYSQGE